MPAFASIEPSGISLARSSALVGVFRHDPEAVPRYQLLPNVRVLAIRYREGPDPGVARFRYVFDPADPATDPTSFQQALSVEGDLLNIVRNDERLVVLKFDPEGGVYPLFDGFAQVPELTLSPSRELVTFLAYGVAVREWDTPIGGALMRDADAPASVFDVQTDLETEFNPGGLPNATPEGADAVDAAGNRFPVFLDPLVVRSPDVRRRWTLEMAARHLCYRHNPSQSYVKNPDGALLESLLDSRGPMSGVLVDPGTPGGYQSQPLVLADYPATGKPWPVALHEILDPHGFGMAFRLEANAKGDPVTRLEVFRRQDGSVSSYKDLFLQPTGAVLDPRNTNLAQASLARDTSRVANVYTVASRPVRYEASFVLAPGFPIAAADAATATALKAFDRNDPSFSKVNRDKYRLYVFDETGEGHWDFASSTVKRDATSMGNLFNDGNGADPPPRVKRRRVPHGQLFSVDSNSKPLRARLAISTNYSGTRPGIWNGTGTWQNVVGGWELLGDRLGVWINVPNPNGWHIGAPTISGAPFPSGVVRGVEAQASSTGPRFSLRLTCVIEGDHALMATAGRRPSSSTSFAVTRRVDSAGRFARHVIAPKSEFNTTSAPVLARDDFTQAEAEARARRLMGEAGEVAGSVTIPRFTAGYRIGDRVRSIQGRDLSLRTNAGAPPEEGEVFPSVVGLTWDFDGKQKTVLQLSDHRGERG